MEIAIAFLSIFSTIYGLYLMLLKSGKRRRGSLILIASITAMILALNSTIDSAAIADGWQSAADRAAARRIGIENPEDYAAHVEKAKAEADRFGLNCLSAWNGSHPEVERMVKSSLRDPSSYEHIDTRTDARDAAGFNRLMTQFRAANGFGGTNVTLAAATFDPDTCDVISFEIVE